MSDERLKREFVIHEDIPVDLQLMGIWSQAAESFSKQMTEDQFKAAVTWFYAWVVEHMNTEV